MLTIIIFGASGDLATKKTFPSLWTLYLNEKLPEKINIVGYSRSNLLVDDIINKFKPNLKELSKNEEKFTHFIQNIHYCNGNYDSDIGMDKLNHLLLQLEIDTTVDRLYYIALPPIVYMTICTTIKVYLYNRNGQKGWNRIVIEKPFGNDLESSNLLSTNLSKLFPEECVYRIDHYLGKEMVQNLLVLRFGNRIFEPLWNRHHIKCVLITFKENIGTYGRGGYYDSNGVIRDFFQNHIIQLLTLVAMEAPETLHSSDIIDEKVKVLKCMEPIDIEKVILGQYKGCETAPEGDISRLGYLDDPSVSKDSKTPTFASMVCYVNNDRWAGVPFIIKSGKALNERKGEIRIQFKNSGLKLFKNLDKHDTKIPRNELVIRLQPDEALYFKFRCKIPGLGFHITTTELDLTMSDRFYDVKYYDAYEKLVLDVINGSHINFVRSDELEQSWKLFTPLLNLADKGALKVYPYIFGSRGPIESDKLAIDHGFIFDASYKWITNKK